MSTISEIRTNITGKSKLDRFRITLPTPSGVVQEVFVKAAGMPGRNVGVIEVKHRGATIKMGGDPTYNEWSVTMYAEDYDEYKKMYQWMNKIADFSNNTRGNPSEYKMDGVKVEQIGLDNKPLMTMTLNGVFPTAVADISFDNESTDSLVEFEVTFSIDETIV